MIFLWRWPPRCEDHDIGGTSRAARRSCICTRQTQSGVEGSLQRYANLVLLRQLHLIDRAGLAHLMPCAVLVGAVGLSLKAKKMKRLLTGLIMLVCGAGSPSYAQGQDNQTDASAVKDTI